MTYTKIATHVSVDVDAVVGTCCELYRNLLIPNEGTVIFVPADTKSVEKGTWAVDIHARKHGKSKSYVGAYCKDLLPQQIVDEVNEIDSTGKSSSRVPLSLFMSALQNIGMTDLEIVQHMYPIVHGWIQLKKEWELAKEIVDSSPKIKIGDYRFLISMDNEIRGLSVAGANAGLNGTIFWGDDGCGITIYPTDSQDRINLSHLQLEGWFSHPAGFLLCWGSRKAPKVCPPPQFPNCWKFIEYLKGQEVFYNKG